MLERARRISLAGQLISLLISVHLVEQSAPALNRKFCDCLLDEQARDNFPHYIELISQKSPWTKRVSLDGPLTRWYCDSDGPWRDDDQDAGQDLKRPHGAARLCIKQRQAHLQLLPRPPQTEYLCGKNIASLGTNFCRCHICKFKVTLTLFRLGRQQNSLSKFARVPPGFAKPSSGPMKITSKLKSYTKLSFRRDQTQAPVSCSSCPRQGPGPEGRQSSSQTTCDRGE